MYQQIDFALKLQNRKWRHSQGLAIRRSKIQYLVKHRLITQENTCSLESKSTCSGIAIIYPEQINFKTVGLASGSPPLAGYYIYIYIYTYIYTICPGDRLYKKQILIVFLRAYLFQQKKNLARTAAEGRASYLFLLETYLFCVFRARIYFTYLFFGALFPA